MAFSKLFLLLFLGNNGCAHQLSHCCEVVSYFAYPTLSLLHNDLVCPTQLLLYHLFQGHNDLLFEL